MQEKHYISADILDLPTIKDILDSNKKLELSEEATLNVTKARNYLAKKVKDNDIPIYGINTGFGSLCDVKISSENLSQCPEVLYRSFLARCGIQTFS